MKLATDLGIPAKRSGLKGKVRTFLDQKVCQTRSLARSDILMVPAGHPLLRCRSKQEPHKTHATSVKPPSQYAIPIPHHRFPKLLPRSYTLCSSTTYIICKLNHAC